MARDDHQAGGGRRTGADRYSREVRIARAASRQHRLVTHEQLRAFGLSDSGIRYRVASRRLHALHPRVYAMHGPPFSLRQRWLAAVLACGPGSALSDLPAAGLAGLVEQLPRIAHVSNLTGRGRSLRGVIVHRRQVEHRDITVRAGIRCTAVARTIVDCAAVLDQLDLEALLLAADSKRTLDRTRLEELIGDRHGQPGTRKLRKLITDDPVETRSINEQRMVSVCREFGVPRPLCNHRIQVGGRTFYADFCWPDRGLIIEADSWRWHGGQHATESDADRDQLLSIAGWQVVHFTRAQILARRECGRRLVALTEQAASRVASDR